jgi:ribosome-associated protein
LTNDREIHYFSFTCRIRQIQKIPEMKADSLLEMIVSTLDDGKGRDITIVDVRGKTSMTDYMVVASGTSERHVKSLAGHVAEEAKKNEAMPLGIEGADVGEWVLVDLGDVVVHVMKPQIRDFFQLEKLWRGEADVTPILAGSSRQVATVT